MERRAVGRDLGLTARMVVVATLVVVLYALLAFGFWTAVRAYPILWVVLPLFLFLGYEGGSHWGGSLAKSDLVSGSDARRALPPIEAMVERLSALADVPRPRVALVRSEIPNAFTLGWTRRRATIAVTWGLRKRLDDRELEAVLAHELAHLAHRDAIVMSGAAFVPRTGSAIFHAVPLLAPVGAAFYMVGTLLTIALSRYREFAADRASAVLTGAPEQLMSALQKIAGELDAIPKRDLRAAAGMNGFFIVPVAQPRWFELAPSHPPLDKRIAELAELARGMGNVA